MSEVEQEFVERMVAARDARVILHGWGVLEEPQITHGDLQVLIPIDITFVSPLNPIPITSFDMELQLRDGRTLFRERQSVEVGGQPYMVGAGVRMRATWHVAVRHMDPQLIKSYLPGKVGLTSRRLDKDTGKPTLTGNMTLNEANRRLLEAIHAGEASLKKKP
jgi:hypothetical protein